jgi:hypothetical protein
MGRMSRSVDPESRPVGWTSSKAWKICACLPLVLLCGVLMVKAVDRLSTSEPAAEATVQQPVNVAEVGQERTLAPHAKQRKKRKAAAERTSDAPTSSAPSSSAPSPQEQRPDPTRTSSPSGTPTSPSSSPTTKPPAPTPTPEEAREACKAAGVNPLDVGAMAECIAESLGGN